MTTTRPWNVQRNPTINAVRHSWVFPSDSWGSRGKNIKNKINLNLILAGRENSRYMYLHKSKGGPLNSHLGNPKQTCKALEGTDGLATCHICSRCGQRQDVRKCTRSRRSTEQDKVWGYAF